MTLPTDLIKELYDGAFCSYNEQRDIEDIDDFPSFNSLSHMQQMYVELTIQAACDTLIMDIYDGGIYDYAYLHEYTTEALTPFFDVIS